MGSLREGDRREDRPPRVSDNSEVVIMDEQPVATISNSHVLPAGSNLNVTKSSRVHIGPKFVSVTQNVQNKEVVLGRILGLELESSKRARRIRCSVAVFVCWAFLVAAGLATYLICVVAAPGPPVRLDIDLPLRKYIWEIIKNSSRTERLACAAALCILIVCISLIVNFTIQAAQATDPVDRAPHEWRISRDMWLAQNFTHQVIAEEFEPLMLVIIQHSVSPECPGFVRCAAELRNLQSWFIKFHQYDIPYNFIIGNDGRVYDGCGWGNVGAHTFGYNRCSVGIGFIGDYREEITHHTRVTEAQLNRTLMLLDEGVRLRRLRPDYKVVGARDIRDTASPGSNLHNAIRQWEHFDHNNLFVNMTCEEMHKKYPYKQN